MLPSNCPYATLSRPFRAPAESGQGIINYDHVFACIFPLNSGIQTFREPFAALLRLFSTEAKTHVHICKCHSDTKGLAWVLERLPAVVAFASNMHAPE